MNKFDKELYQQLPMNGLNQLFEQSCQLGHMAEIKFLLTSPDLRYNVDIHVENDTGLRKACEEGQLRAVKYLLTSPDLKDHANINAYNGEPLTQAAQHGHLNVVKFLLTAPEITKAGGQHADIDAGNGAALNYACMRGHLNIVKFLLTNALLAKPADVHLNDEGPLRFAYIRNQTAVVDYLINEFNIDKTPAIEAFIQDKPELQYMFEQRDNPKPGKKIKP